MTTDNDLLAHLLARTGFKSADWVQQLPPRKREELDFHNFDREVDDASIQRAQQEAQMFSNRKYYSITASSREYVDRWLATHVPGRVFLDYACGNGDRAIQAAKLGARLSVGLDISDVSVRNARRSAALEGVDGRCFFVQGDCESTELPKSSVDVILCSGMFHHLDLARAYPELARILRPGGRLLGVEALGHNPIIQWYRNATPQLRTAWEAKHILKMKDVRMGEEFFGRGEVRFWHFLSLGAVPFRSTVGFRSMLGLLERLDTLVLRIPGIRLMAWQVTFELIRPILLLPVSAQS